MLNSPEPAVEPQPGRGRRPQIDFRLIASLFLLAAAVVFTRATIDGLERRRELRTQLAEISHVRYGLLNAGEWVARLVPILDAKIDAIDLTAGDAALHPVVEKALYRLLDDVKEKMSAKPAQPAAGLGGMLQGNAMIANMMIGALRPHVPEYTGVVLAQLGSKDTKEAVKKYIRGVIAEGAKATFSEVDMSWYNATLQRYGCADGRACQEKLGAMILDQQTSVLERSAAVLLACAAGFVLLLSRRGKLRRSTTIVLLLFCITLLVGGVVTPMIEVEAKISSLKMSFLGAPISFSDQVLYFQSKSVLEVFRALIDADRPDMYAVGILVLMFSIVFPTLKLIASSCALYRPGLLQRSRIVKFFALESSKWSMADVMALAIFMAFVAFNGLIPNTMAGLTGGGAQLAIPTNSSRILPGYYIFIGFCLASLFLARRLAHGIETPQED
jgi:Paraquat-inducible protein A